MVPFSHLISDSGVVTVFVNGKPYVFAPDFSHYDKVKKAIAEKNADEIVKLGTLPKAIESFTGDTVKVEHGVVTYKGKQIHNSLTRRILKLMAEGFPFTSMLKFLENLMSNPSQHAVNELYSFLVNRNLPITENGCFLAYKAVRPDYMDWHSGNIRNQVGDTPVRMERNEVDDNWRTECSSGYHVGAIEYVTDFHRGKGHVMIVEVNPADVVSVPVNEFTKCRTCFYTVVGEMDGELLAQVYKTTQTSYAPSTPAVATGDPAHNPSGSPIGSMSNVNDDDYPDYPDDDDDDDDDDDEDDSDLDDDDEDDDDEYGAVEP